MKYWFFLLIVFSNYIEPKVLIYSYSYNRPDFIRLQKKTFDAFCIDDYEFKVFNDATDQNQAYAIQEACKDVNVEHIRIPQEIHDRPYLERLPGMYAKYHHEGVRNANVVQWSLDNYGFNHDDILVLIDSDLFLTKSFSFRSYLNGYQLASYLRKCNEWPPHDCLKIHPNVEPFRYLWIGLVFLDMKHLPNKRTLNFNCGRLYDSFEVDAGGYTHLYLVYNPEVKIKPIEKIRIQNFKLDALLKQMKSQNFRKNCIELAKQMYPIGKTKNIEFYLNDTFVHYGGGTNYVHYGPSYITQKSKILFDFMKHILEK